MIILAWNSFSTCCSQQGAWSSQYLVSGLFVTERWLLLRLKWLSGWCFLTPPLQYESKKRISAEEAMKHSYFRQLGMRVHTLAESERTHARTHTRRESYRRLLLFFPPDWRSSLSCCRHLHIHAKRSAAPERPGLQELLVPRVRWVAGRLVTFRAFIRFLNESYSIQYWITIILDSCRTNSSAKSNSAYISHNAVAPYKKWLFKMLLLLCN